MSLVSVVMLCWIAGTVLLTWVVPRQWQPHAIIAVSMGFLGIYAPVSLAVLALLSLSTLLMTRRMPESVIPLIVTIGMVIFLLAAYKLNRRINPEDPAFVLIPMGLSYYALRIIHFVFDRWRGTIDDFSFLQFFAYMFFLPTLMAGPINRFQGFARSLRRRRWDSQLFSLGCERILYGYVKITFIANFLVNLQMAGFMETGTHLGSGVIAYLGCLKYGLNLYFQFSGYSDIAIGFALLLGFRVEENFHFPFLAVNINDFWKRWHITLSNWCRDYIYISIRALRGGQALAVILAMLVLGMWHEFSWRYIAWGFYHGAGIALWQGFQHLKSRLRLTTSRGVPAVILTMVSWAITMNFVVLSFAITSAPDLKSAWQVYRILLGFGG